MRKLRCSVKNKHINSELKQEFATNHSCDCNKCKNKCAIFLLVYDFAFASICIQMQTKLRVNLSEAKQKNNNKCNSKSRSITSSIAIQWLCWQYAFVCNKCLLHEQNCAIPALPHFLHLLFEVKLSVVLTCCTTFINFPM